MADTGPNSTENPTVSPIKARQGDTSFANARVLFFSLVLLVLISLVAYAGWLGMLWTRTT